VAADRHERPYLLSASADCRTAAEPTLPEALIHRNGALEAAIAPCRVNRPPGARLTASAFSKSPIRCKSF
jgi:hypothetical protein